MTNDKPIPALPTFRALVNELKTLTPDTLLMYTEVPDRYFIGPTRETGKAIADDKLAHHFRAKALIRRAVKDGAFGLIPVPPSDSALLVSLADRLRQQGVEIFDEKGECTIGRLADALKTTPRESKTESKSNGPSDPYLFVWKLKSTKVQPLPWKLLDCVWHATKKQIPLDDAIEKVWGEKHVTKNALSGAIKKVNRALEKLAYPKSMSQKSGLVIIS